MFIISYNALAQESTSVKLEAPKIVVKLMMGNQINIADVEIRFIEVISDSRCPNDVNCVWAGEAKVVIALYKNNKFLENKTIVITPTNNLQDKLLVAYTTKETKIGVYNLLPYPVSRTRIKNEDYFLQLIVED